MGYGVGEERPAAHEHGDRVVVRGLAGGMAQPEEGWAAETQFGACGGDTLNGMGDERASAGARAEYACACCLWVDVDGCGGRADCGDFLCIEG